MNENVFVKIDLVVFDKTKKSKIPINVLLLDFGFFYCY
ncbi:hypothetical protein RCH33_2252 [Flavobacterium daejeonense]|nr:hypothetical protein RCH33_2252 [Flavobacterium daejeonense]